jgi:hypothetical protein
MAIARGFLPLPWLRPRRFGPDFGDQLGSSSLRRWRSLGIFRIEKMSEKGLAGSSRTIIGGNKSIGMSVCFRTDD